jgi:hypothetical protein
MDGNNPNEHIDPEKFRLMQSAKLVLHTPRERANYIQQLDEAIGADDGTSLKSKAELVQLRQDMARTDAQLRALKR